MRTIEITVSPDGQSKVETKGFAGASCQAASKFLEHALGKVAHERLTEEFYQQAGHQQSLQQGA